MPGQVESMDREKKRPRTATKHLSTCRDCEEENEPFLKKGSKVPSKELARAPGESEVIEAPTKLSFGFCTMETIW